MSVVRVIAGKETGGKIIPARSSLVRMQFQTPWICAAVQLHHHDFRRVAPSAHDAFETNGAHPHSDDGAGRPLFLSVRLELDRLKRSSRPGVRRRCVGEASTQVRRHSSESF